MRIYLFMFLLQLSCSSLQAAPVLQADFFASSTSMSSEQYAWVITLHPSAKHHFNVKAPITASHGFDVLQKEDSEIRFKRVDGKLNEQTHVTVTVYLCDDANTYCVKKTRTMTLGSILDHTNPIARALQATPLVSKSASKKAAAVPKKSRDRFGFWDNAIDDALNEARSSKKPLLIDFYGIWCPPCNQFIEHVFPSKTFRDESKNFVLLKLDADHPASFALKSRFKVGGYPTIVFARLASNPSAHQSVEKLKSFESLQEIDRLVGYMHPFDFAKKMKSAFVNRNYTLEARFRAAKGKPEQMDLLREWLTQLTWQGEDQKVTLALEEALHDPAFQAHESELKFLRNTSVRVHGTAVSDELLESIKTYALPIESPAIETPGSAEKLSSADLLRLHDWALDWIQSSKKTEGIELANAVHAELKRRLAPQKGKPSFISGIEMSEADVAGLRLALADALQDSGQQHDARHEMIAAYQQMLKSEGSKNTKDTRSIHLELAALYRLEGEYQKADEIYQRFIKKYPKEFTFYLGASKLRVAEKKWNEAIVLAKKAVQYSYGDNQIRSILQLAVAQDHAGNTVEAEKTLTLFLQNYQAPDADLQVRSKRYLTEVSNFLQHLQTKGKSP